MAQDSIDDLVSILEAIAEDDYSRVPQGHDRASAAIRKIIARRQNEMVHRLDEVVENTIGINEMAGACASMFVAGELISKSADSVAVTSEQLSASVNSINDSIGASRELTGEMRKKAAGSQAEMDTARGITQRTADSMRSAVERAASLVQASEEISQIVGTIDSIAMQTNLLALNASVEAARAGAAGRGFSVVAQEVRGLSEQTAKATANIHGMVRNLREEVTTITKAISGAEEAAIAEKQHLDSLGEVITALVESVNGLDDRLTDIAQAVTEQTGAASELAGAASEASRHSSDNNEAVKRVNKSLEALVSGAGRRLAEAARIDVPGKIARLAKADHVIWKKRLSDMFAGQLALNEAELSDHRRCRLGTWYYGPDAERFRHLASFQMLEKPHAMVHEAGIQAVRAFNAGRREEALKHYRTVETASVEVLRLLDQLVREDESLLARAS